MIPKSTAIAAVVFATLANAALAEEVKIVLRDGRDGFYGTRDVAISVDSRIAQWNQGASLSTAIWQFEGVTLLMFDFDYSHIPVAAKVKAAELELICTSVGFADEEIQRKWEVGLYNMPHSWIEGTGTDTERRADGANQRTSDGSTAWPSESVTATLDETVSTAVIEGPNAWYRWSLDPELVQGWISGERENRGLVVWGKPPGKAVSFASREGAEVDHRPALSLTLELEPAELEQYRTEIEAQRVSPDERAAKRRFGGLGIRRDQLADRLKVIDPKFRLIRNVMMYGQPMYESDAESEISLVAVGPRENLIEFEIMARSGAPELERSLAEAGLEDLLQTVMPRPKEVLDWVVATVPKSRQRLKARQPAPISTTRDGVVVEVMTLDPNVFVAVRTPEWHRFDRGE